jgi:hypothetical protein
MSLSSSDSFLVLRSRKARARGGKQGSVQRQMSPAASLPKTLGEECPAAFSKKPRLFCRRIRPWRESDFGRNWYSRSPFWGDVFPAGRCCPLAQQTGRLDWGIKESHQQTPFWTVTGRTFFMMPSPGGRSSSGEQNSHVPRVKQSPPSGTSRWDRFRSLFHLLTGNSQPSNHTTPPAAGRRSTFCQVTPNRPHPCPAAPGVVSAMPNSFAVSVAPGPSRSLDTCALWREPSPDL